jgi:hypothetical protein
MQFANPNWVHNIAVTPRKVRILFSQKPHDNVLAVLVIYVEEFLLLHGFKILQSRFISILQDELWQHCTVS